VPLTFLFRSRTRADGRFLGMVRAKQVCDSSVRRVARTILLF
jgi:hypothetical protein